MPQFIKTIDRYIIRKYLGTFGFTLVLFLVIIVVFDVSEHLDDFLKYHAPLSAIIFQYYAGYLPFYANILLPLINFLAVIFFTAKMANQTEIVPILSGKMSFNRFLWPYFVSSSLIFVCFFFANLYLIPYTNKLKVDFENTYFGRDEDPTRRELHMQVDKHTFIYLQSYDEMIKTGYNFELEKFDGDNLKMKLTAPTITYDSVKKNWSFLNYSVRYVNGLKEKIDKGLKKDTTLDMHPADFDPHVNIYGALSTKELSRDIEKEKLRGTGNLVVMQLEDYRRFVYPLASYVLALIGVSISSRKVRGGIGLPLGIGIFLCFAYIVVDRFANVFSLNAGLPPIIAVFIPNVLFGIFGFYLLRNAPK